MLRRYDRTSTMDLGNRYGTSYSIPIIRQQVQNGNIRVQRTLLKQAERLDVVAGCVYGDSQLYWLIAAASSIGYSLQCPAGTILLIPNLEDAARYM